jgi:hypothetical protein
MLVVSAIWWYQEIGWHPLSSFKLLTLWNHEIIYCQREWNTSRILDWFIFNFTLFLPASIMPPGLTDLLYPNWHCNHSVDKFTVRTNHLHTWSLPYNLAFTTHHHPCYYQAPTHRLCPYHTCLAPQWPFKWSVTVYHWTLQHPRRCVSSLWGWWTWADG